MPRRQVTAVEDRFLFRDRADAGRQLADRVAMLNLQNPLVLALPRGGVPAAVEIAQVLRAPLDLLLVRKLGLPWQPELAVGAVLDGDAPRMVINADVAQHAHMNEADIRRIAEAQLEEIAHRRRMWLDQRAHVPIEGRSAILVDDGIATGASVRAALDAVKARKAARTVLAVPVVADFVAEALRAACDEAVFLATPQDLASVGMYYRDFHQLRDDEVKRMLSQAWDTLPAQ
jgi:putative phosphoribosyl transferase